MMNVDKRVLRRGGELDDSKPAWRSWRPVLYRRRKPRRRARKSRGQAKMGRMLSSGSKYHCRECIGVELTSAPDPSPA